MLSELSQQRVDRFFLNLMRGRPIEPLVSVMLRQFDINVTNQFCQIDNQLFLRWYSSGSLVVDGVFVLKFEIWVDFDILLGNAGLFFEFAKSCLLYTSPSPRDRG